MDDSAAAAEATRNHYNELIDTAIRRVELKADNAQAGMTDQYKRLQDLTLAAQTHVESLPQRVTKIEETAGGPQSTDTKKSLVQAKHMLPSKLTKADEWRRWRIDIEDFAEAPSKGLKEVLKLVAKTNDGDYSADWFDQNLPDLKHLAEMREEVWRMLKQFTEANGEARKVVESTLKDDGWWASTVTLSLA